MIIYMVNGYYDFYNSMVFIFYISVGVGFVYVKLSNNIIFVGFGINEILFVLKNNFVWGVGIGVKYVVIDNIMIDVSYKYINVGKVSILKNYYVGDEYIVYDVDIKVVFNDFMFGIIYVF